MMSYTQIMTAEEAEKGIKPLGIGSGNMRLMMKHPQSHQGVLRRRHCRASEGITRADVDALGYDSQQKAKVAIAEGRFAKSARPRPQRRWQHRARP